MQQHRLISLASILVMLIIPAIGWFLIAQPQLAAATIADEQRVDMEAQIEASSAVVAQLKADSAQLPKLNDQLNKLRTAIPAGVDSSGYIDGLDALAQYNGVAITSLTVDEPTSYVPAVAPIDPNAVAPAADEDAEGESATPAPAPVADPAIVTNALITSSNFVAVPVTISVTGQWSAILNFVDGLQSSPRLFLVTSLDTATVDGDPSSLTGNIGGYIYAIPTGVEGKPRPISTTVKQLTAIVVEAPVVDPDAETDGPTPDPTETPAP